MTADRNVNHYKLFKNESAAVENGPMLYVPTLKIPTVSSIESSHGAKFLH